MIKDGTERAATTTPPAIGDSNPYVNHAPIDRPFRIAGALSQMASDVHTIRTSKYVESEDSAAWEARGKLRTTNNTNNGTAVAIAIVPSHLAIFIFLANVKTHRSGRGWKENDSCD